MKVVSIRRVFSYGSVALDDPNPSWSVQRVREFYAGLYPDLIGAVIKGPKRDGETEKYVFEVNPGILG